MAEMMNEVTLEGLAAKLARFLSPDALVSAADIGVLTNYSARYVLERLSKTKGFPKAVRFTGPKGTPGEPRWLRRQVTEWIEAHFDEASRPKRGARRKEVVSD